MKFDNIILASSKHSSNTGISISQQVEFIREFYTDMGVKTTALYPLHINPNTNTKMMKTKNTKINKPKYWKVYTQ